MNYKTDISFRKDRLKSLMKAIIKHEDNIVKALHDDFRKPAFEAVITETSYVLSDLRHTIKSLESWTKPKQVFPSWLNFPSSEFIYSQPYGTVLIIAPWNYPFQLAMCPLIAAVAAGNQVVLKPSELTSNTASIIEIIVAEAFDHAHVEVFQGGAEVSERLLKRKWDYIFFTGSVPVGKLVARAAAEHLTPVTLELGGKNPCIVDKTANIELAAKRITWGKFINAGQTCIAPDYLLVHQSVKQKLIENLQKEIKSAFGEVPQNSSDLARIINKRHFDRLVSLIHQQKILIGGQSDASERYIAPTIIDEPSLDSSIMKEEIFGPLLPVLSYESAADLPDVILKHESPLALYVFSDDKHFAQKMIDDYSFGGGCINDTVVHFSNKKLPFGGVGASGMGAYHGKLGFDTFSHKKAIVKKATWLDLPMRYAPYEGKLPKIKRLLDWI